MKSSKGATTAISLFLCGITLVIGLVFMFRGSTQLKSALDKKESLVSAEAVISKMEPYTYEDSEGDTVKSYHVYVDYTSHNGVDHKNVPITSYQSNYQVGKEITIYYDSDYPNIPYTSVSLFIGPTIFLLIGLVFTVVSLICLIGVFRKKALATKSRIN